MGDAPWRPSDAPRLDGRVAVVTGANSGIGYQTARLLAHLGARTVLACRSAERGERALERLRAETPGADAELAPLDLADLASVRAFAEKPPADRIDILVNNAGVMALPYRTTADGFEMQFGTNHLGHFALTGLLLPHLLASDAPRVVTVSSELHRIGRMRFNGSDRPAGGPSEGPDEGPVEGPAKGPEGYRRWSAYSRSKLANLLFSGELHRRAEREGTALLSVAAHPGMAGTDLAAAGPALEGRARVGAFMARAAGVIGHSDLGGALPSVRAAVDPGVQGDAYVGPTGLFGLRGVPRLCRRSAAARDRTDAARLWDLSEELTGVVYDWG